MNKARTGFIPAACLSLFGTIQPGVLADIFTGKDAASGLLARVSFVRLTMDKPSLWTETFFEGPAHVTLVQLVAGLLRLDFHEDAPIHLTLEPDAKQAFIAWHDDLAREQKLEKITDFASIAGIALAGHWEPITPDAHGDWLKQRDAGFSDFLAMGSKEATAAPVLFSNYSRGVATARDAWCYNASKSKLTSAMRRMIDFYNSEVTRFEQAFAGKERKQREAAVDDFINTDPTLISWTRASKQDVVKGKQFDFARNALVPSLYRPFTKQWLYFNRHFNEMVYQMPRIFPDAEADNVVICVSGPGCISGFTALISNVPVELCISAMKGGSQCFPLYLYDEPAPTATPGEMATNLSLLEDQSAPEAPASPQRAPRTRREAITDAGLAHFQAAYPGEAIGKEDIFYYV